MTCDQVEAESARLSVDKVADTARTLLFTMRRQPRLGEKPLEARTNGQNVSPTPCGKSLMVAGFKPGRAKLLQPMRHQNQRRPNRVVAPDAWSHPGTEKDDQPVILNGIRNEAEPGELVALGTSVH